jgi:hypothetical protein
MTGPFRPFWLCFKLCVVLGVRLFVFQPEILDNGLQLTLLVLLLPPLVVIVLLILDEYFVVLGKHPERRLLFVESNLHLSTG